jgi:DNA/RNA-binding domain of Phe-tRNA-synthetase-like protein
LAVLDVESHPLLKLGAFVTVLPAALAGCPAPEWLRELLELDAAAPLERGEDCRKAVRDLLRHGGYKPTGRGKPASEYLVRAAGEGGLSPINLAVDACNAVSLHSGLPISVVDLDRAREPLRVGIAKPESAYVFNASGQEIRIDGLLCLHDAHGPCANAVKDAQRTKTDETTTRTLSLVWGIASDPERTDRALAWYQELLVRAGAECDAVPFRA